MSDQRIDQGPDRCPECQTGLQHCHGAIIHHLRFQSECTEDGCETPERIHTFSLDCAAVGCRCGQAAELTVRAG